MTDPQVENPYAAPASSHSLSPRYDSPANTSHVIAATVVTVGSFVPFLWSASEWLLPVHLAMNAASIFVLSLKGRSDSPPPTLVILIGLAVGAINAVCVFGDVFLVLLVGIKATIFSL